MISLRLTDDQRDLLKSGAVSSIIVLDPDFSPITDEYRAISISTGKDFGVVFKIRDIISIPLKKLRKHGYSNDFVKSFREGRDPDQNVSVCRIKITKR